MDTLVLSAAFEPVARVCWQRAVTLLFAGKVEVVEEYEDRWVRSVTLEIRVPSVIRFLKGLRGRRHVVKFSRENVWARDRGRCQYCGTPVARPEATFDHVVPRAQGGRTCWENVVIACVPCNQRKGGHTPEQARMRLLAGPVRPKSVPDAFRMTFVFQKGMPSAWRQWLRSAAYWNAELEDEPR
jgi:5-methylcytosine-specific restriction endonuclease McrA